MYTIQQAHVACTRDRDVHNNRNFVCFIWPKIKFYNLLTKMYLYIPFLFYNTDTHD